jgi:hypothetical protein
MRVLPGLLLGVCFVLGTALMALFVVLLLRFVKLQGGKPILEIEPYPDIGQIERIKRPAFLPGLQD